MKTDDEIHAGPSASWEDVARVRQEVIERLNAELAAARADWDLLRKERDQMIGSALIERKRAEKAEAEAAIYREALEWCAAGKSPLARDYATTAESALHSAARPQEWKTSAALQEGGR